MEVQDSVVPAGGKLLVHKQKKCEKQPSLTLYMWPGTGCTVIWLLVGVVTPLADKATLAAAKFETKLVAREDESAWVSAEVIKVAAPASSDAGMVVVKTTVAARRAVAADVTEAPWK